MPLFLHAFIMAAIVWLQRSYGPMWSKWSITLGGPLIAGLINGIFLNDLAYGLEFGATVMMVFMGVAVIGGAVPSDPGLAGYIGVTISMLAHADVTLGVTVAATLAAFGAATNPFSMTLCSAFVHRAQKYADEGNTKMVALIDWLGPVALHFVISFIPCFIAIYFGAPLLDSLVAIIPAKLTSALATVGHLLPALGLAMLMQLLFKNELLPFMIFGFVLAAYMNLSIIPIALIAVGLAILHYNYSNKEGA